MMAGMAHTEEQSSERRWGSDRRRETLTVTDNRTGQTYEIPITDGTVRAPDFRQIKVDEDDFGLMTYDPAFMNTASCRSAITYIDGDEGILEYRGYPIEQLARALDVPRGRLPAHQRRAADAAELDEWTHEVTIHTFVHENVKSFMQGFRYDAHPMGMLLALGRRAVDLLSRRREDQGRGDPPHPDHPADRQDADARRLLVTATTWASRTSIRTTT